VDHSSAGKGAEPPWQAQKETIGFATGGKPYQSTGLAQNPVAPTLASQGIDKNLAGLLADAADFLRPRRQLLIDPYIRRRRFSDLVLFRYQVRAAPLCKAYRLLLL